MHLNNDCETNMRQTVANLSYLTEVIEKLCAILKAHDIVINVDELFGRSTVTLYFYIF